MGDKFKFKCRPYDWFDEAQLVELIFDDGSGNVLCKVVGSNTPGDLSEETKYSHNKPNLIGWCDITEIEKLGVTTSNMEQNLIKLIKQGDKVELTLEGNFTKEQITDILKTVYA